LKKIKLLILELLRIDLLKKAGEFFTETKGPGQFSWLVLPIVTAL
jgi:hypothetical protein